MVAIGEESDNLEEMLNEIALHYDSELEYAMKRLSDSGVHHEQWRTGLPPNCFRQLKNMIMSSPRHR